MATQLCQMTNQTLKWLVIRLAALKKLFVTLTSYKE